MMSSDHKALAVVAAVAVMGVGVRLTRAPAGADTPAHAAEPRPRAHAAAASRQHARATAAQPPHKPRELVDMDGATLAQIESLPGIGPTLASRIVLDRAAHGPFLNKEGLHRVKGVGPVLLRRLDSLVTFSGRLTPLPDSAAASLKPDGVTSRADSSQSRARKAKKRSKKGQIS